MKLICCTDQVYFLLQTFYEADSFHPLDNDFSCISYIVYSHVSWIQSSDEYMPYHLIVAVANSFKVEVNVRQLISLLGVVLSIFWLSMVIELARLQKVLLLLSAS